MKTQNKGFTLTEVLIVLVIAGILIALILPNAVKAIERANVAKHLSNLDTIDEAIMLCYTQERDWDLCDDIEAELIAGDYLDENPNDDAPFGAVYSITDDPDTADGKVATATGDFPEDLEEDEE